jgi:hypothetical protein
LQDEPYQSPLCSRWDSICMKAGKGPETHLRVTCLCPIEEQCNLEGSTASSLCLGPSKAHSTIGVQGSNDQCLRDRLGMVLASVHLAVLSSLILLCSVYNVSSFYFSRLAVLLEACCTSATVAVASFSYGVLLHVSGIPEPVAALRGFMATAPHVSEISRDYHHGGHSV